MIVNDLNLLVAILVLDFEPSYCHASTGFLTFLTRGYSGFEVKGMIEGFFWVEIFDTGMFFGRTIWQAFFCVGCRDLSRDILNIPQNNLKIRGNARVSRPRSSVNKVQPNLFCSCFNI